MGIMNNCTKIVSVGLHTTEVTDGLVGGRHRPRGLGM